MKLIFQHSDDRETVIAEMATEKNVITKIKDLIVTKNPNFDIHYIRSWETKRGIKYDVGSHTEFFLLGGGNPID